MSDVAQPQTVLSRWRSTNLLLSQSHPSITDQATDLLTNHRTDYHAEELHADLLGVETELLREDLGDLDGEGDTTPEEDHGVSTGWDEHAGLGNVGQGLNEVPQTKRRWVDAAELEDAILDAGDLAGGVLVAQVEGFRAEEEVQNELDAVDLK